MVAASNREAPDVVALSSGTAKASWSIAGLLPVPQCARVRPDQTPFPPDATRTAQL
ncbi:hypothetical protein GCM10023108_10730 [Saccharopolyspora hordei]